VQELVTVEPMETSEEPPLCSGGEELGYWSHWQQSSPALFVPPEPSLKSLGGCPATCNDPHSLVCETSEPVRAMRSPCRSVWVALVSDLFSIGSTANKHP
jgi:hypothetical protein